MAIFSFIAILTRPLVPSAARLVARRRLLAIGSLAVGVAMALMLIAHSLVAVLLLRALAGVGDAFFYVLASTSVYTLVPEHEYASAQSRFSAVVSAGILLGPIIAETLRPHTGYAGIWLFGAGLCAAAAMCVSQLRFTTEPGELQRRTVLARGAVLPGIVIAAQTWALSAFTVFVVLYANHLGLDNANAPFAMLAAIVLALRTVGAGLFDLFEPRVLALTAMGAATAGLALLALVPDRQALLAASALIAISQALGFPALLHLAVQRAGRAQRIAAVATFTGFFEAGLASAGIALGAVLETLGFSGLYGLAAAISAAALLPLLISAKGETNPRVPDTAASQAADLAGRAEADHVVRRRRALELVERPGRLP